MNRYCDVVDSELELEEFAKIVMQSKKLYYRMSYIEFFLNEKDGFFYNDLKKILENRDIKIVFDSLKKNGISIRYGYFCRIIKEGNLKEKRKRQKREVVNVETTQTEMPKAEVTKVEAVAENEKTVKENPPREKREKPKTLAQIRVETEAFFKKDEDVPDIVKRQIERLKKENAEREWRKSNERSDS